MLLAFAASLATYIGGAYVSRKFGLPGIASAVETQRLGLTKTLQDELSEVRTQLADEKRGREGCEQEMLRIRQELRDTEAELLALYRKTRQRPPRRLIEHEAEQDR